MTPPNGEPKHDDKERQDAKVRIAGWIHTAPAKDAPEPTGDLDDPALQEPDE
jgi:hypothetical protein